MVHKVDQTLEEWITEVRELWAEKDLVGAELDGYLKWEMVENGCQEKDEPVILFEISQANTLLTKGGDDENAVAMTAHPARGGQGQGRVARQGQDSQRGPRQIQQQYQHGVTARSTSRP